MTRNFLGTPATAPGPLGPQMLRSTMMIRRDPLAFLAQMRDDYGDVVQFPIPRPATYLVASASATQQVLVGRPGGYDKDTIQYRSLSLVTGDGLLTATNDHWRGQRPVVQPAFHHSFLPAVGEVVAQETGWLIDRWGGLPAGAVVDVELAMMDLALRVVGRCLFADDLRGSTAALAHATLEALDVVIKRSRVPIAIPAAWPTPANRRLDRSMRALESAVERLMTQRIPEPGSTLLLDLILSQPTWSRRQMRDQIVTFLVAGHETAASAMTWALWLLARDPDRQVPPSGVSAANHARACAEEALRLFPPAWVISRNAVLADEIEGIEIPAGALVITSPFLLHRDSRYWPDPDRFDPGRFADRLAAAQRAAYLPFGAGPRLCIGRDFARWEMTQVIEQLLAAFEWSVVTPQPPMLPSVTLRPVGGLQLAISRR